MYEDKRGKRVYREYRAYVGKQGVQGETGCTRINRVFWYDLDLPSLHAPTTEGSTKLHSETSIKPTPVQPPEKTN